MLKPGFGNFLLMPLKREKKLEKKIAKERIRYLLNRAQEIKTEDYELSRRYVELAVKIAKKYRIRLGKRKIFFCKKCLYPYSDGRFRVRIHKSRVIITCLNCGFEKRVPVKPKRVKRS